MPKCVNGQERLCWNWGKGMEMLGSTGTTILVSRFLNFDPQ